MKLPSALDIGLKTFAWMIVIFLVMLTVGYLIKLLAAATSEATALIVGVSALAGLMVGLAVALTNYCIRNPDSFLAVVSLSPSMPTPPPMPWKPHEKDKK